MIQTGSTEPIQFDGAVQPKIDQFTALIRIDRENGENLIPEPRGRRAVSNTGVISTAWEIAFRCVLFWEFPPPSGPIGWSNNPATARSPWLGVPRIQGAGHPASLGDDDVSIQTKTRQCTAKINISPVLAQRLALREEPK